MNQLNIRVMVVEDEEEVREEYRRQIKERGMLQLVAETDNSEEAARILETHTIDALILDLEMPQGSGILLLEKIQQMQIEKPFIAVVTNVVSKAIYDSIREMGVDYICTKSDVNFSLRVPISIIEISAPYRNQKTNKESEKRNLNFRTLRDSYLRNIEFELSRFGFSLKTIGTLCLREAILYVAMSERSDISLTKELYPHVAEKFGSNVNSVEKNIRNAIEKVWTERDIIRLKELYSYEWSERTGRPTNAEFIFGIVQKLFRH